MFNVTERAVGELKRLIQPPKILQIYVQAGGCHGFEYILQFIEPITSILNTHYLNEFGGVWVFIDAKSYEFIKNATLDYDFFKGFLFENPQAESICGCGNSFSAL